MHLPVTSVCRFLFPISFRTTASRDLEFVWRIFVVNFPGMQYFLWNCPSRQWQSLLQNKAQESVQRSIKAGMCYQWKWFVCLQISVLLSWSNLTALPYLLQFYPSSGTTVFSTSYSSRVLENDNVIYLNSRMSSIARSTDHDLVRSVPIVFVRNISNPFGRNWCTFSLCQKS